MAERDDGWKEKARMTHRKEKNKTLTEAVHGLEDWRGFVFFTNFPIFLQQVCITFINKQKINENYFKMKKELI